MGSSAAFHRQEDRYSFHCPFCLSGSQTRLSMVHSRAGVLGWCCCILTRVIPQRMDPYVAWGVPVQVSMEVAVAFHVLGRRHQAFMLSAGRFIIPSPGSLGSFVLQPQLVSATGEHTLRVSNCCQAKCNCWWSWGGCKCSLWELFDIVDPTLNQEGKEETAKWSCWECFLLSEH